jgi:hypothetical protein
MDGGGALNVYGDAQNYFRIDGGTVDIKTDEITIQTGGTNKLKLFADGTNTPTFAMGATLPTAHDSGNGFFVDGTGKFLAGNTSGNYMNYDGSTLTVAGTINIVAGDLAGVSAASISASINTATGSASSSAATALLNISSSGVKTSLSNKFSLFENYF